MCVSVDMFAALIIAVVMISYAVGRLFAASPALGLGALAGLGAAYLLRPEPNTIKVRRAGVSDRAQK